MEENTACCRAEKSASEKRIGKLRVQVPVSTDVVESAQTVGLHYISDESPGIRRRRYGKGFAYYGPGGKQIRDPIVLERITSLKIPPAWKSVWISPIPEGHLQVTGRDTRGRKQYIYHPLWRTVRDQTKFNRMALFGKELPKIRRRTEHDLALPGLKREKVLATVVVLLERTLIRIGNKEYVRQNRSFGLTTMMDNHTRVSGPVLRFHFRGKSGKEHIVEVNDRRLARIVKRCRDISGHELFQYIDDEGQSCSVDSSDVNAYLKEITNEQFTSKDFRLWGGTLHAVLALEAIGPFDSQTEAKSNIVQVVKKVAQHLGNKPSICRKHYIHPAVFDAYLERRLLPFLEESRHQDTNAQSNHIEPVEHAILDLLRESAGTSF